MKKFLAVSSLIFVAVFLTAITALAAAKEAPIYNSPSYTPDVTCRNGSDDTNGPNFGVVVMDINGEGKLAAYVSLKGAAPNETFDIWVNQYPGACPLSSPTEVGALQTNEQGDGSAYVVLDAVSGAERFWISAIGGGQVLRSTAVQLEKL